MTAGSAFYPRVAQCIHVCFEDIFFLNVFLIWVLKKVIKARCKKDSDWRHLWPSPCLGNRELGERVETRKGTRFLADSLLLVNRSEGCCSDNLEKRDGTHGLEGAAPVTSCHAPPRAGEERGCATEGLPE